MFDLIKMHRAKKRIPSEAYELIENVNSRYAQLDFSSGDFAGLGEGEKLSRLIEMINQDPEISRLNSLSGIGSIITVSQQKGSGFQSGSGSGLNICVGKKGLFIYDWDDFKPKHEEVPIEIETLRRYAPQITSEGLRKAIVEYTDRKEYEKTVANFNKFN